MCDADKFHLLRLHQMRALAVLVLVVLIAVASTA